MRNILILTILAFSFSSCKKDANKIHSDTDKPNSEFVIIDYSMNNLEMNDEFSHDTTYGGTIQIPALNEASGLAVSRVNNQVIWSHNDSGHPNRIYALGFRGENKGVFVVQGAGSRDWEDICVGPGPEADKSYLYIGDIGDNQAQHSYIIIYRLLEPLVTNQSSETLNFTDNTMLERFEFEYPDEPKDAETLMIDPWNKDLYVVSKRGYRSIVYRASFPQNAAQRKKLEKIAQLPFNWAVAGDISSDGKRITIKVDYKIYCWERMLGESLINALRRKPQELPYVLEPQGESFAWNADGNAYFTLSEQGGIFAPELHYYKR